MPLHFNVDFNPTHGAVDDVASGLRRIVANNPGPYTFRGTGTYIVGRGDVAVVDPGPKDEAHIESILHALAETGERVSHILITHTHPDHSPGTVMLKERTGATVYAFGGHPPEPTTPEDAYVYPKPADGKTDPHDAESSSEEHRGDVSFRPDITISTGDVVDGTGWRVEALHTPGHIANHLCFALLDHDVVFTGDHVMGWSTSVISPPGGNLSDYLASLQLLADRPEQTYVPTHGAPIAEGSSFARALLEHRNNRTAQVLAQLRAGETSIPKMVEALYVGLDERLIPAAGRSLLAHVFDLIERGDVVATAKDGHRVGTASEFRLS